MACDLRLFEQVKQIEPFKDMQDKLIEQGYELTKFNNPNVWFYSLEILRLSADKKLLFVHSDMVVVKFIGEFFARPEPFCVCAQLCYYKRKGGKISAFESEAFSCSADEAAQLFEKPVDTGFMLNDGTALNKTHYLGLFKLIEPSLLENNNFTHTDEPAINQNFGKEISLPDTRYNYWVLAAQMIMKKGEISFWDAWIIHYYAAYKPWHFGEVFNSSANNMNWIRAYETWYHWYIRFLKFYHLRTKTSYMEETNKTGQ